MFKKFYVFLTEIKNELMEKTTWPSRDETLNATVTVIVSLIFVSLFLFGVDYLARGVIDWIVIGKVASIKKVLLWLVAPTWGIPWRFLALVVLFGFCLWLMGRIKRNWSR